MLVILHKDDNPEHRMLILRHEVEYSGLERKH